jgi:lipopolysaccharide transport system permease protein
MNDDINRYNNNISPIALWMQFWVHKTLIYQLTKRALLTRYKNSYLGILWSLIQPLLMLSVYSFVFGVVFKARWGIDSENIPGDFVFNLFCGMIIYYLFSETISVAPALIVNNVNFVKKVVFPLEILPIPILCSNLIHAFIGIMLLLLGLILFKATLSFTVLLFPLVLLPLLMLTLGMSWVLSSLGVYFRDLNNIIGLITQVLVFMTPIFYPISAVPARFQGIMYMNPLTFIVENARRTLLKGQTIEWVSWFWMMLLSFFVMWGGYVWFVKSKRGFADVI